MPDLRNCKECGRLYAYNGRGICSKCADKEEEEYLVVRRYVRDHPGATVFEVSEDTGVEEEKIINFLKDGRLESKGMEMVLKCRNCGAGIMSGDYCYSCQVQLQNKFDSAIGKRRLPASDSAPPPPARKGDRMHIRNDDSRR